MNRTTDKLLHILEETPPEKLRGVLFEYQDSLIFDEHPFAQYIRELLRRHGKTQEQVIVAAGFSIKYGYRLLSEERHTRQRDYILRLCLAAELELAEVQRLLRLYGMAELYPKLPRDALLISCIAAHCSLAETQRCLAENAELQLRGSEE